MEIQNYEYPEDVEKIHKCLVISGYPEATKDQAHQLWTWYSESMAAGWMMVPDSNREIMDCINYYIVKKQIER